MMHAIEILGTQVAPIVRKALSAAPVAARLPPPLLSPLPEIGADVRHAKWILQLRGESSFADGRTGSPVVAWAYQKSVIEKPPMRETT